MSRSLITAALLAALVAPAQGDGLWKRATEEKPAFDAYAALMTKGDDAARVANTRGIAPALAVRQVDEAIDAYRAAAKAKPTSGEPWFRIGSVLNSFYFDGCEKDPMDPSPMPESCRSKVDRTAKERELLDAWDRFEQLAPLDSRVNELLYRRAILRTKMLPNTKQVEPLLRAVVNDYQALLDRKDGLTMASIEGITGNLAETHMMLGDVEEAVKNYVLAIKAGGGVSTVYGLAVALDRSNRGALALDFIRSQGVEGSEFFDRQLDRHAIFFVPEGEVEYYFALRAEAFGDVAEAVDHWKAFIRSGAHPQFQPRAKEHLDALMLRRNFKIDVPIISPDGGREPLITPQRRGRP